MAIKKNSGKVKAKALPAKGKKDTKTAVKAKPARRVVKARVLKKFRAEVE